VRVVSLVPSITETLLAWGITPVACTRFCEQPDLTHVGGTKDPDLDAIVGIAPDVVLVNDEENRREDHDALVELGFDVHVVRVNAVDDVPDAFAALAAKLGIEVDPIVLPPSSPATTAVFVPIWKRPWMSIGSDTYGSSILGWCGATNVCAGDDRYPELTLEEAAARHPSPRDPRCRGPGGVRGRPRPLLVGCPHARGDRAPTGRARRGARTALTRRRPVGRATPRRARPARRPRRRSRRSRRR
jgi:hypothetical protein